MTVFLNIGFLLADYLNKGFDLGRYSAFIMNRSLYTTNYRWLIKRREIKQEYSY